MVTCGRWWAYGHMWEVVGERLQSPDKAWRSNDVRSERGMNEWQCTAAGRVLAPLSMAVYCCWEGARALKHGSVLLLGGCWRP
jgi:hypothetical protein